MDVETEQDGTVLPAQKPTGGPLRRRVLNAVAALPVLGMLVLALLFAVVDVPRTETLRTRWCPSSATPTGPLAAGRAEPRGGGAQRGAVAEDRDHC